MNPEKYFAPWVHGEEPELAWLQTRVPPELKGMTCGLTFGRAVGDAFPGEVVFGLSPSKGVHLADSISNCSNLYVVSERLRGLLERTNARFEFHRVGIRNKKGRLEKAPYYIANLLDVIDCMDRERSDFSVSSMDPTQALKIRRLVLDLDKIPDDTQIFRLGSERRRFMVRKDLAFEIFRTQKCDGLLFMKIEHYGEEFRPPGDEE